MTYREHLVRLLDKVIEKSEKYFEIGTDDHIPLSGTGTEKLKQALEECAAAKVDYHAFLEFVKTSAIDLDDKMPD